MRARFVLPVAVLASCASQPPPVGPKAPPRAEPAPRVVDQGHFVFQQGGNAVGGERFTISETASGYRIETNLSVNMGASKVKGTLETDGQFHPRRGTFSGDLDGTKVSMKLTVDADGVVDQAISVQGQTQHERSRGKVDLFVAAGTLAHLAPLCFLGDGALTLTIFPSLEAKIGPRRPLGVEGRSIDSRTASVGGTTELSVACEGTKLVAVAQPFVAFTAAREGDEAVLAVLAPPPREKPATPDDLVELPRTIKLPAALGLGDDATLACSLMVPKAYAKADKKLPRLPAVVFITGSGPQDRDEDTVGPGGLKLAIFKVMAIALAHGGIASLRCDDVGVGESTGDFGQGTREGFAGIVKAQLAALRGETFIDGGRLALVGHSEGGLLAPLAASTDPRVRAMVLMAGPGRSLDTLILEQTAASARRAGASEEEAAARVAHAQAVFDAWRAGKPLPDDVPREELTFWRAAEPWLKSYLGYDPLATARKLPKVAVLIAQGGKDVQVREVDARALEGAFKAGGNGQVTLKLYPELNHLFAVSKTGDVADYGDPKAVVDEGFLGDVVGFLRQALRVK